MNRGTFLKNAFYLSIASAISVNLFNSCSKIESEDLELKDLSEAYTSPKTYMVINNLTDERSEKFKVKFNTDQVLSFDLLMSISKMPDPNFEKEKSKFATGTVTTKRISRNQSHRYKKIVNLNGYIYDIKDFRNKISRISVPIENGKPLSHLNIELITLDKFNSLFPSHIKNLI